MMLKLWGGRPVDHPSSQRLAVSMICVSMGMGISMVHVFRVQMLSFVVVAVVNER